MTSLHDRPMKVLLVERYPDELDGPGTLETSLDTSFDVETSRELSSALQRLSRGGVDVVLLDLDLPDSQGITTFERTYAFAPDVPIVVLTGPEGEGLAISTVQGGAQDHLVRTQVSPELVGRALRYAVERHRLLSALRSLSLIDDLTGLYNRRGFLELGDQYLKLARRSSRDVTLVYLDLDRFKTINDTLGHHVGDRALVKVADILRNTFRRSDVLARIEGDEFGVLALDTSPEDARALVERVRERFHEFNHSSREPFQLAATFGQARRDGADNAMPLDLQELLREADGAVSGEKKHRRAEKP